MKVRKVRSDKIGSEEGWKAFWTLIGGCFTQILPTSYHFFQNQMRTHIIKILLSLPLLMSLSQTSIMFSDSQPITGMSNYNFPEIFLIGQGIALRQQPLYTLVYYTSFSFFFTILCSRFPPIRSQGNIRGIFLSGEIVSVEHDFTAKVITMLMLFSEGWGNT